MTTTESPALALLLRRSHQLFTESQIDQKEHAYLKEGLLRKEPAITAALVAYETDGGNFTRLKEFLRAQRGFASSASSSSSPSPSPLSPASGSPSPISPLPAPSSGLTPSGTGSTSARPASTAATTTNGKSGTGGVSGSLRGSQRTGGSGGSSASAGGSTGSQSTKTGAQASVAKKVKGPFNFSISEVNEEDEREESDQEGDTPKGSKSAGTTVATAGVTGGRASEVDQTDSGDLPETAGGSRKLRRSDRAPPPAKTGSRDMTNSQYSQRIRRSDSVNQWKTQRLATLPRSQSQETFDARSIRHSLGVDSIPDEEQAEEEDTTQQQHPRRSHGTTQEGKRPRQRLRAAAAPGSPQLLKIEGADHAEDLPGAQYVQKMKRSDTLEQFKGLRGEKRAPRTSGGEGKQGDGGPTPARGPGLSRRVISRGNLQRLRGPEKAEKFNPMKSSSGGASGKGGSGDGRKPRRGSSGKNDKPDMSLYPVEDDEEEEDDEDDEEEEVVLEQGQRGLDRIDFGEEYPEDEEEQHHQARKQALDVQQQAHKQTGGKPQQQTQASTQHTQQQQQQQQLQEEIQKLEARKRQLEQQDRQQRQQQERKGQQARAAGTAARDVSPGQTQQARGGRDTGAPTTNLKEFKDVQELPVLKSDTMERYKQSTLTEQEFALRQERRQKRAQRLMVGEGDIDQIDEEQEEQEEEEDQEEGYPAGKVEAERDQSASDEDNRSLSPQLTPMGTVPARKYSDGTGATPQQQVRTQKPKQLQQLVVARPGGGGVVQSGQGRTVSQQTQQTQQTQQAPTPQATTPRAQYQFQRLPIQQSAGVATAPASTGQAASTQYVSPPQSVQLLAVQHQQLQKQIQQQHLQQQMAAARRVHPSSVSSSSSQSSTSAPSTRLALLTQPQQLQTKPFLGSPQIVTKTTSGVTSSAKPYRTSSHAVVEIPESSVPAYLTLETDPSRRVAAALTPRSDGGGSVSSFGTPYSGGAGYLYSSFNGLFGPVGATGTPRASAGSLGRVGLSASKSVGEQDDSDTTFSWFEQLRLWDVPEVESQKIAEALEIQGYEEQDIPRLDRDALLYLGIPFRGAHVTRILDGVKKYRATRLRR